MSEVELILHRPSIEVVVKNAGEGLPCMIEDIILDGRRLKFRSAEVRLNANEPVHVAVTFMPESVTVRTEPKA